MRRRHSKWRSFVHGFLLAGVPVMGFVGADYLFAPPASTAHDDASVRVETISKRINGIAGSAAGATSSVSQAAPMHFDPKGRTAEAGAFDHPSPRSNLAASIQQELRRVGCYAGVSDGVWNDQTRTAMAAFNEKVSVSLKADRPDFILLTLLQGHSGKACTRPDAIIEARAAPAVRVAPGVSSPPVRSAGQATTSSGKIQSPIAPTWSVTTTLASRSEPVADDAQVRANLDKAVPLPGRMTVGALDPEESVAVSGTGMAPETASVHEVSAVASARPSPVARPAGGGSGERKIRLRRIFTNLSANSP